MTRLAAFVAAAVPLAACPASAPVAPVVPGPVVSIAPVGPDPRALVDGFTPEHPRRAVLGRAGEWRTAFEDPWNEPAAEGTSALPVEVLVAEERPEGMRVVMENAGLRVAMWVRPSDLAVVPTERIVLSPAPDEPVAGDGPGVQLAPGVAATVVDRKDGWVLYEVETREVAARGWVRETRVGRVYLRQDFNVACEVADLEPMAGTTVHDRPDGALLATLRPEEAAQVRVKDLGVVEGEWREVLYPTAAILVRGWVRAERLAPGVPSGAVVSGEDVVDAGAADGERIALPAGTDLLTGPGGEPFAYPFTDLRLAPAGAPPSLGGVWVVLPTPWGEVIGWIEREPAIR